MKRLLISLFFISLLIIIALVSLYLVRVRLCELLLGRILGTKVSMERAYFDFNKKIIFIDGLRLKMPKVFIEKAKVDIPNTEAIADNLTMYDRGEEIARITQLFIKGPSIGLLFKMPVMDFVTVKSPTLKLTRSPEGKINLFNIFKPKSMMRNKTMLASLIPTRRLIVEDGKLHFVDHFVSKAPAAVTDLAEIFLDVNSERHLRITRDIKLDVKAKAAVLSPLRGRITIAGTARPFSKKKDFALNITAKNIDLLYISPYYDKWCPVTVESGRINLDGKFLVNQDIQDSYYVAETYGLSISTKETAGFGKTLLGIPISSLISSLEDEGGHIVLDCYGRGPLSETRYSPGPISQELFFAATIDMLKKGIELFKNLKK